MKSELQLKDMYNNEISLSKLQLKRGFWKENLRDDENKNQQQQNRFYIHNKQIYTIQFVVVVFIFTKIYHFNNCQSGY